MHLPPDPSAAWIGLAIIAAVVAFAVRHVMRTAPVRDDWESSSDERTRIAQMPLPDRIAHDQMADFFAEWDERVKEESAFPARRSAAAAVAERGGRMNRATTITEWLTWAATIPPLDYTPTDLGDEPSPTSATGVDPDGAAWEDSTRRSFDGFAA